MLPDLNDMVPVTVTVPLFIPAFKCYVTIKNSADHKIRGLYADY